MKGKEKAVVDLPPSYETSQLMTKTFQHDALALPFTIHGSYEDPLFVANEVGGLLGIKNISNSLKEFGQDEKDIHRERKKFGQDVKFVMPKKVGKYHFVFA